MTASNNFTALYKHGTCLENFTEMLKIPIKRATAITLAYDFVLSVFGICLSPFHSLLPLKYTKSTTACLILS